MDYTILNLTRRQIALHCNSRKTLYLGPGCMHDFPEEEIKGNALVDKLTSRRLISVKSAKTETTKKTTKKAAKKAARKAAAKSAKKTAPKKEGPKVAAQKLTPKK